MGFIVGIDIGSSYIRAVFAEERTNKKKLMVHGLTETKIDISEVIEEGTIINYATISELVFETLTELMKQLPAEINGQATGIADININVSGRNIELVRKSHTIHLKGTSSITVKEVEQLFEEFAAVNLKNLNNKRILHLIPTGYKVDGGRTRMRKPTGQHGADIAVEAESVLINTDYLNAILLELTKYPVLVKNSTLSEKIKIDKIVYTPFAVAAATLSEEALSEGVAVVDMGAEITNLTIFKDRGFIKQKQIMIGGSTFTKDLSNGLGTRASESLKILYSDVNLNLNEVSAHDVFVIGKEKNKKKHSVLNASIILKARFIELFSIIYAEIEHANIDIHQIVLCGGLSNIEGLADLVQEITTVNDVEIADVSHFIESEIDEAFNTNYTTAIGLVLWDLRSIDEYKNSNFVPTVNEIIEKPINASKNEKTLKEGGGIFGKFGRFFNNDTDADKLE